MPLYSTVCPTCFNTKDVLVRSHSDPLPRCTEPLYQELPCDTQLERTISAAAQFNLKGNGWYRPGVS